MKNNKSPNLQVKNQITTTNHQLKAPPIATIVARQMDAFNVESEGLNIEGLNSANINNARIDNGTDE